MRIRFEKSDAVRQQLEQERDQMKKKAEGGQKMLAEKNAVVMTLEDKLLQQEVMMVREKRLAEEALERQKEEAQRELQRKFEEYQVLQTAHSDSKAQLDAIQRDEMDRKIREMTEQNSMEAQRLTQASIALPNKDAAIQELAAKEEAMRNEAARAQASLQEKNAAIAAKDQEMAALAAQEAAMRAQAAKVTRDLTEVQRRLKEHAGRAQLLGTDSEGLVDTMCKVLAGHSDIASLMEAWKLHCETVVQRQQDMQSVEVARIIHEEEKKKRDLVRDYQDKLSILTIERDRLLEENIRFKAHARSAMYPPARPTDIFSLEETEMSHHSSSGNDDDQATDHSAHEAAPTAHLKQVERNRKIEALQALFGAPDTTDPKLEMENYKEVQTFMKKKAFMQAHGWQKQKGYFRWRCANSKLKGAGHCQFVLTATPVPALPL